MSHSTHSPLSTKAALATAAPESDLAGASGVVRISVVVPTRERGATAARCVASLLANQTPWAEVILVDQSSSDSTEQAIAPYRDDPRFIYIRSRTKGASAARNIGVRKARAEIIAHIDDDCEAPGDWLPSIDDWLANHPEVDVLFGDVAAGPHVDRGFIPSYRVRRPVVARGVSQKHRIEGISACMAYRRSVWDRLGGFDERLGVGTPFGSAEEVDFTIRALDAGSAVAETPTVAVVHHGFRTWEEYGPLISRHLFGIGAASAKQIRRLRWPYFWVLGKLAARWMFGGPLVDFGRKPSRMPRLKAFLRGFAAGWRHPIDDAGKFKNHSAPEKIS